ncbi:MAG: PKD domain-containing protein [Bacteroidales bacterium]|nr:PKD domain-containing protein [Bacteroidales bacterium]
MTVSKGGTPHTITKLVTVTDQLIALFIATPRSGAFPLRVNFTDKSSGNPTAWQWDFGDGKSSTDQNPTHTYNSTGNYNVKLTVLKDIYTDATDGTFTIVVNDPTFYIRGNIKDAISGNNIQGINVEAQNSDGTTASSDDTDSQGNYELWVSYEWTGKVYAYGGENYSDNWLNFGNPIISNQENKNMLLEPVTLDIVKTQKPNLFYEFKVEGTPWGTLYEWDMDNDGFVDYQYQSHLGVVNHQYQCEIGSIRNYTVNLTVTAGGSIYKVTEPVSVPACSHVNSALAFAETDCNVFGMWGNYTSSASTKISKIEDLSYPSSEVYRVKINWERDRIYDSENCNIGDCKANSHSIFDNNCRVFDDFHSYTVGHYSISLTHIA